MFKCTECEDADVEEDGDMCDDCCGFYDEEDEEDEE